MFYRKKLKYIFLISCAIAIIYPLVNMYVIFPSFQQLLIENTEEDAASLAKSLSPMVVSDNNELKAAAAFSERLAKVKEDYDLEKLKVFSASGEIIYSSDPDDIGKFNTKNYFFDIVAKGNAYTKSVRSGTKTLEDRLVTIDVVETYVPIMNGPEFVGAFEIYYDITHRNSDLNAVAFHSALISFGLVFSFFVLTTVVLFSEDRKYSTVRTGKLPVIYQSPFHLLIFVIGAIFVSEAFVMFVLNGMSPQTRLIRVLIDSALLVMVISPFLYYFLLNPLTVHIGRRERAEEELKKSYGELELRIRERTRELTEKNRQLGKEITERKRVEEEREQLIHELKDALVKVKTLKGLLPICCSCNKIRDEKGDWTYVDVYISEHSEAELSHGYCPECATKFFPQSH